MAATTTPWPIRSVVFDLDGLLIDSERIFRETARRLLDRRRLVLVAGSMEAMMGSPARQALEIFRRMHELPESVEELAAECSQIFFEVLGQAPVDLMPGALALLDRLERKGMSLAMATSSSARYVRRILEPYAILPRFQFVLTSDDVLLGKPYPEIYQKAALRLGHAPHLMVVLEDSPNGLRAAKAAGARCIVVPHALVPLQELADADAIVPSLQAPELLRLLGLDDSRLPSAAP